MFFLILIIFNEKISLTVTVLVHLYLSHLMTKPTKWHVCPAKTQISLGIRPVWSKSSLSAWRKLGSLATHLAHSGDSDQTRRMPRLSWVFAGRTVILSVLSWGGSFYLSNYYFALKAKAASDTKPNVSQWKEMLWCQVSDCNLQNLLWQILILSIYVSLIIGNCIGINN